MTNKLILILGDQLSKQISSLQLADRKHDRVLMVEVAEEASYVQHHKKKIAFIFSAMRHFAEALRMDGWTVDYIALDSADNTGSFKGELKRAITRHAPSQIIVTEPGEWRVLEDMRSWQQELGIPVDLLPDDRFIATHDEFASWAACLLYTSPSPRD